MESNDNKQAHREGHTTSGASLMDPAAGVVEKGTDDPNSPGGIVKERGQEKVINTGEHEHERHKEKLIEGQQEKQKFNATKTRHHPQQQQKQGDTPAPEDARCCLDVFPLWCCTIQ